MDCWSRALTLFTRSLPLNLALRIWDCFVLLGTPFFFQASVGASPSLPSDFVGSDDRSQRTLSTGILTLYEDALLGMEAEDIMRFLHNIPKVRALRLD